MDQAGWLLPTALAANLWVGPTSISRPLRVLALRGSKDPGATAHLSAPGQVKDHDDRTRSHRCCPPVAPARFRFRSAFTLQFALIVLVAALTSIIPAGEYARIPSEPMGKDVPVAGSYATTEADPQGFSMSSLPQSQASTTLKAMRPMASKCHCSSSSSGSFIGVLTTSGAVDAETGRAMVRLKGHEKWMIPIQMLLFTLTFAVTAWGVSSHGWWMAQTSRLVLTAAIVIGIAARLGEARPVEAFVGGACDLLGVALITGLAHGIVVVTGCDSVYIDVWVSMGEPETMWAERIGLLTPTG